MRKKRKLSKYAAAKLRETAAWAISFGTLISMYIMAEHGITDGRILIGPLVMLIWALHNVIRQSVKK